MDRLILSTNIQVTDITTLEGEGREYLPSMHRPWLQAPVTHILITLQNQNKQSPINKLGVQGSLASKNSGSQLVKNESAEANR